MSKIIDLSVANFMKHSISVKYNPRVVATRKLLIVCQNIINLSVANFMKHTMIIKYNPSVVRTNQKIACSKRLKL